MNDLELIVFFYFYVLIFLSCFLFCASQEDTAACMCIYYL